MHFFVYEWVTGGGLVEEPGRLPRSLLTEGAAMLGALAGDFLAISGAKVTVLRDIRWDELVLPGCKFVDVHSNVQHLDELQQLAAQADCTVVIAPETDGVLARTMNQVRGAGGRLLGPCDEFVKITSDKHLTAERLAGKGVPVPEARLLDSDVERLPHDFTYPAVLKPVQGAGSQHTFLIADSHDEPPPYSWPRRLERFHAGTAASVSFLCGPSKLVALPAFRQNLSSDGRFAYQGGSRLSEQSLAQRATALAERAMTALPPAVGYVGVDLVLGKAGDGRDDVVIEVNPRLTTSYVGLRAIAKSNLAQAMVDIAAGRPAELEFREGAVEFLADGSISLLQAG